MATLWAVFLVALAEMGDKTQLLALGLGAHFESVLPVVLGSVAGVFLVNAPLFWGGEWFAARVSMVWARRGAAARCASSFPPLRCGCEAGARRRLRLKGGPVPAHGAERLRCEGFSLVGVVRAPGARAGAAKIMARP